MADVDKTVSVEIIAKTQQLDAGAKQAQKAIQELGTTVESAGRKGAEAMKGFSLGTAGATREILVLAHEVISGNFSRIPGSLIVLGERAGGLHTVIEGLAVAFSNPLVIGVTAATAAIGAFALQSLKAEERAGELRNSLLASGQQWKFSADQMRDMERSLSHLAGVSSGEAHEALIELNRVVGLSSENTKILEKNMYDISAAMGVSIPKAAQIVAEAMRDPENAVKRLQKEYDLLTIAEIKAFQAAERDGDKQKEQSIIVEALARHFKDASDNITSATKKVEQFWQALAGPGSSRAKDLYERGFKSQSRIDKENAEVAQTERAAELKNEQELKIKETLLDKKMTVSKKSEINLRLRDQERAIEQEKQKWQTFFGAFNTGLLGMLKGTMTFKQGLASIADGLLNVWLRNIEETTAAWLAAEFTRTGATVAGNTARTTSTVAAASVGKTALAASAATSIGTAAAEAAAHTYASIAAIPIVGPILAPPAAAAAFVAVGAYKSFLPSFDVGTNFVPNDMMANIHKGERIIPAADNQKLMDAIQGGGGSGMAINFHGPVYGMKDFQQAVAHAVGMSVRNFNPTLSKAMK